ncbi:MAG: potassium channel family protein [Pseudomonadota bacterium]
MRSDSRDWGQLLTLRRKSPTPPWLSLVWRVLFAFGLIGIALVYHWVARDGLRDNVDGKVSFIDVLYFTMITVTTVGYGDIIPVTDEARLFDTFIVTPIRIFVWLIFLGTAYDFVLKGVWERWRMSKLQKALRHHIIVAGHGTSGSEAVQELIKRGTDPKCIVVVDERTASLDAAANCGAAVLAGDATRNPTLEAVRIADASALIVAAGRDDTSILIVLTARRLAPAIPISVVIRAEDNEPLARQAGANTVINPASFAGLLLASSTHGSHVADAIMDLASVGGQVALRERRIAPAEVGSALADLTTGRGLRFYRDGRCIGFWEDEARALEAGDLIVEVVAAH